MKFVWLLVCYGKPPAEAEMEKSKKGNYFRRFETREEVFPVARLLRAAKITWQCHKIEDQTGTARRTTG